MPRIVVGRPFPADGVFARLCLVDAKPTSTGVVIATYRQDGRAVVPH